MSEVIRGAGTVSLGKAVEALDTLGSTMTNLNPGRKFASGIGGVGGGAAVTHGNKIGILAFEVANTIVKGCNLKQSLERDEIKVLKDEILVSKGVQLLVSTDMQELMWIAAADKRLGFGFFFCWGSHSCNCLLLPFDILATIVLQNPLHLRRFAKRQAIQHCVSISAAMAVVMEEICVLLLLQG